MMDRIEGGQIHLDPGQYIEKLIKPKYLEFFLTNSFNDLQIWTISAFRHNIKILNILSLRSGFQCFKIRNIIQNGSAAATWMVNLSKKRLKHNILKVVESKCKLGGRC